MLGVGDEVSCTGQRDHSHLAKAVVLVGIRPGGSTSETPGTLVTWGQEGAPLVRGKARCRKGFHRNVGNGDVVFDGTSIVSVAILLVA